MTPMVPVEVVVVAVLAFLAVLALVQAYTSLKRKEQGTAAGSGACRPAAGRDRGFGGPVRAASGARQEARGRVGRA